MLKNLSDSALIESAKKVVAEEKRALHQVLEHISEIESRRLYAERGYPSLYEFVMRELNYDEASAYRRITAARAMRQVPEVKAALQEGTLTLSTVTLVQAHLKHESKSRTVAKEERRELFEKVHGLSRRETERYLVSLKPEKPQPEKIKPISESKTELKFTVAQEFLEKLERLKQLYFHKNPDASMEELLGWSMDLTLEKKDPLHSNSRAADSNSVTSGQKTTPALVQTRHKSTRRNRHIPTALRRKLFQKDQASCQYEDSETGRVCGSKMGVQLDHIKPYSWKGAHSEENLQCLCATHNALRARQMQLIN